MEERKVATSLLAFVIVFFATIIGALGSIYLKKGSKKILRIKNLKLYKGLILYAISSVLFIWALKHGDLSVLYPITSLSYVWVSFLSILMIGERMNKFKWIGVAFIMLGVSFIGVGA